MSPLTSCGISTLGEKLTLPIEEIILHFDLGVNLQTFTDRIGNHVCPLRLFDIPTVVHLHGSVGFVLSYVLFQQ